MFLAALRSTSPGTKCLTVIDVAHEVRKTTIEATIRTLLAILILSPR
jgi:hypothetical protein